MSRRGRRGQTEERVCAVEGCEKQAKAGSMHCLGHAQSAVGKGTVGNSDRRTSSFLRRTPAWGHNGIPILIHLDGRRLPSWNAKGLFIVLDLVKDSLMRRFLFSFVATLLMLPVALGSAAYAQDASPVGGSPFADLGLPELTITVTASGYEGIPASTPAGRYLVTVNAADDTSDMGGGGVSFVQPAGMSGQDFVNVLTQMQGGDVPAAMPAEGTPDAMASESTPAESGGDEGAPAFFYQSKIAGGSYSGTGQTTQVVLDLTPGEWVAWGDDPSAPQQPVVFEATGEMPADLPEPASDVTLTMAEYSITVTEGQFTAGPQVVRVENAGEQPHFVFGGHGPSGMTDADIEAVLQADMTGTPAANGLDPETDFQDVFGTGTQSTGTTQWVYVPDVPAGSMVLLCFFPDQGDGMPHAMHGMYAIVEVAG
jgi:hypothetical protein